MGPAIMPDIHVERWNGGVYMDEKLPPSVEAVESCVHLLQEEWSSTITIEHDTSTLIIGESSGQFIATVLLDSGDIYDLVGNTSARGSETLFLGGQESDIPRRKLITADAAAEAASQFLRDGGLLVKRAGWEPASG